jgi:hypothetical protein
MFKRLLLSNTCAVWSISAPPMDRKPRCLIDAFHDLPQD